MYSRDTVAIFDFDHTLTNRDSFLYFLFYSFGWLTTIFRLCILAPFFFLFFLKIISRQQIKERIISFFLKKYSLEKIQKLGEIYAKEKLNDYLNPIGMQRLLWHRQQGHRCLLISASPEFYLHPWALQNGFEAVLASQMEISETGGATGKLKGLNCWGAEKVRRFRQYLSPSKKCLIYAYGDSRGDRELLEMSDFPFYRRFS